MLQPGSQVFLPSPISSSENSTQLEPFVLGNQVKTGILVFSQILQAQSLGSQNFLLISDDPNPPLPHPPLAATLPYLLGLIYPIRRVHPNLSLHHVACAVYHLLFIWLHVQVHSLKHINSHRQIIYFLQNYGLCLTAFQNMQAYSTRANYKRVANIFEAIMCPVQKPRGKMGEGMPHGYSISKFDDLSPRGMEKLEYTTSSRLKKCPITLNEKITI